MLERTLVKIGAKVVRHAKYLTFQMVEVAVSRQLYSAVCDVNLSPPLPKRPDRGSRPPS